MKKTFGRILLLVAFLSFSESVSAQGFLKKLTKGSKEKTETVESKEGTEAETKDKINVKDIPAYSARKVYVIDENKQRVKNEDGTDKYCVELIRNSDGVRVSPEMVQEQSKQINKAILAVAAKAGTAGAVGFLSGGGKGALVGVATGLGLSVNDITTIVKLKKESNKQKKALELYRKSFDEEGYPTTAKVDKNTLKTLEISEDNAVEKTTADIAKELSDPKFKEPAKNESIDALLEAATKA